ncbi:MAG: VCBS repeat-containing protein [bacterium]
MPALATFSASTGSYLEAYGYGGGTVKLPALTTVNLTNGTLFHFNATGAGAEVDVDALATLPSAVTVIIASGGLVKAPSLTTLTGAVTMSGSGNGFTSALTTISGALTVAGATISLPSLTSIAGSSISVASGGALTITGAPSAIGAILSVSGGGSLTANGLTNLSGGRLTVDGATSAASLTSITNIDNVSLSATSGGHVSLPGATSMTCNATNKPCYSNNPINSSGTGSQVTLSNLATLTVTTGSVLTVGATSGASVGLAALATIATTTTDLTFSANGTGSQIDLSALHTGGYDAGHVTFSATNGGAIVLPAPLTIASSDGARAASNLVLAAQVDLDGDGEADTLRAQRGSPTLDVVASAGPAGTGSATSYRLRAPATALALADWDGDGALDVAVAVAGASGVAVLLGVGDGTFVAAPDVALPFVPRSIAAHDANADGIPDLVVVDDQGESHVTMGRDDGGLTVPGR